MSGRSRRIGPGAGGSLIRRALLGRALRYRPRWRRLTLRSRIALISAGAVATAVVAVSAIVFFVVAGQLHRQLDNQLTADAHAVAEQPGRPWNVADPDHDHDHDVGPRVQILDEAGRPTALTAEAGLPVGPAALAVVRGERDRAFEDVRIGGQEFRLLTVPAEHGGSTVQVAAATDAVDGPLDRIGLMLLLVGAGGIAVATALGFLVARAGLGPVHRLTGAVEHVAATNDLSGRIAVDGRDEIARLAEAFNGMLAALRSSRAAQRLLVEDAGHELRTPLTSLRANIELLIRAETEAGRARPLAAEDRAALLRDLDLQTAELTQLAGELVELARDGSGAEPVERVDLADLVEAAAERVRQRWPEVTFTTRLRPVTVPGRPASLERMVSNLLDNAAKWGGGQGPVRVRLDLVADHAGPGGADHPVPGAADHPGPGRAARAGRAAGEGWAELTVADDGPGIDEADLPRIFERFYRAASARSRPGSGLGLAIVAQAVELHGGEVWAGRSDSGGARFTVRLPVSGG